jgi:hypothetical protein
MNIRDNHSKHVIQRPLTRDYVPIPEGQDHLGPDFGSIVTGGKAKEFSDTLAALVGSNPEQIAGVISAIASELREAADESHGTQSRFLGVLANRFENATSQVSSALTDAPSETIDDTETVNATASSAQGTLSTADNAFTTTPLAVTANPAELHPHFHHRGAKGVFGPKNGVASPGFLDPKQSAELISKILDAVTDAIAKVSLAPNKLDPDPSVTSVTIPLPSSEYEGVAEDSEKDIPKSDDVKTSES